MISTSFSAERGLRFFNMNTIEDMEEMPQEIIKTSKQNKTKLKIGILIGLFLIMALLFVVFIIINLIYQSSDTSEKKVNISINPLLTKNVTSENTSSHDPIQWLTVGCLFLYEGRDNLTCFLDNITYRTEA